MVKKNFKHEILTIPYYFNFLILIFPPPFQFFLRIGDIRCGSSANPAASLATKWATNTSDRIRHSLLRELEPFKYKTRMTGIHTSLADASYKKNEAAATI